ncbi:MAG: type VI secretion system baseplate subunit TssE [Aquabacterium sp.]
MQPSLLDRLTDNEPASQREGVDARVLNKQQLRAAVLRDLSWLLNSTREEPDYRCRDTTRIEMWRQCPEARRSLPNYGIPSLSGTSVSTMDFAMLEMEVKQSIIHFEPRIDPRTLEVEVDRKAGFNFAGNSLRIIIRGQMWNQPVPLELLLSADVNVETGQTAVRDLRK